MPYYSANDELRALRQENAELKARLLKLEHNNTNFTTLSHSQMMKFFVEHFAKYSYDESGLANAGLTEIYRRWESAYQPFKEKRSIRQALIKSYLKAYFANKTDRVLVQDEVVDEIMPKIKEIYFDITPFDCEDKKWVGDYCDSSWRNRIHSFFNDMVWDFGLHFTTRQVCVRKQK